MTRLLRSFKTLFKIPEIAPQTFFTPGADMGTVVTLAFDGRRRTPRHAVRQIGMILGQQGATACYCLVLDRSDKGVRIRIRSDFEAPSDFVMRIGNADLRYSVVWRKGSILGARLVS